MAKNPLVEEQRKKRDARFFKLGGSSEFTLICPESSVGPRRSFRLTFTMEQIGAIERLARAHGYTTLTPYQFASFGNVEVTFLAILIARGTHNDLNKGAKDEVIDEDAILKFMTSRPGIQKYWAPVVYTAFCDAYDRDIFAPEEEEDPRLPDGSSLGEGTGAEA